MHAQSLSTVWLFATPWTATCKAHLSMGLSKQQYWSGLPFLSLGDLPDPEIKPTSPMHWWADSLPLSHLGSHVYLNDSHLIGLSHLCVHMLAIANLHSQFQLGWPLILVYLDCPRVSTENPGFPRKPYILGSLIVVRLSASPPPAENPHFFPGESGQFQKGEASVDFLK